MTEASWLACAEPTPMLQEVRPRLSDRKLRLWACACVRRIWHLIPHELGRRAIVTTERFVDGRCGAEEIRTLADTFYPCGLYNATYEHPATRAAHYPLYAETVEQAARFAVLARKRNERSAEVVAQADLLRHIVGNPFRRPPEETAWSPEVTALAKSLYEGTDCAFALHDALLESGAAELAEHFGRELAHPRGCWALDLILNRC